METAMRTGQTEAEENLLLKEARMPDEERMLEENREADDLEEPDPEEASICLTCARRRCLLDEDKPCLRYRRAMRALRIRRARAADGAVCGGYSGSGMAAGELRQGMTLGRSGA